MNMFHKSTVLLSMVYGTYALTTLQDECTFTLKTNGEVSAPVGQYGSGQTRARISETPSKFVLKGDTIVDEQGRGCWWTPPALVLQCDVGQIPETGFGIGCDGAFSYNSQTIFYECVTGVDDLVMIYREPNGSNCGEISLKSDGCNSDNCGPSKSHGASTMTVPSNSSTVATATKTSNQLSSTASIAGNSTIASNIPTTSDSTGSSTVASTTCETTKSEERATTSTPMSSITHMTSHSSTPVYPTSSNASTYGPCESDKTSVYATIAPPNTAASTATKTTEQLSSMAATTPVSPGQDNTTSTQAESQPSSIPSAPSDSICSIQSETQNVPAYPTSTTKQATTASTSKATPPSPASNANVSTVTSYGSEGTNFSGNSSPTATVDVTSTIKITSTVPCNTTATGTSGSSTNPDTPSTLLEPTSTVTTSQTIPTGTNATSSTLCTTESSVPPALQQPTTSTCTTAASTSSIPSPQPNQSCPGTLTGDWQAPSLLIPIDYHRPRTALGPSPYGTVSGDISTLFQFNIPASYAGRTCSAIFLWPSSPSPSQSQSQSAARYTYTGTHGALDFARLVNGSIGENTTFASAPTGMHVERWDRYGMRPGTANSLGSFACPAATTGEAEGTVVLEMSGLTLGGDTAELTFLQGWEGDECPLGLYLTAS